LILALARNIEKAVDRTKESDFSIDGLKGFDIKGKTLGVVGAGHIGQHVIKIGRGFEMNIIAFDPHPDKKLEKGLGFKHVSMKNLLAKSDIVTLHAPLNEHTKNMINLENIKMMKKGSYLINTARGGLVDTTALLYGLNRGILAGAALDVLEGEMDIKEEAELLHKPFEKEKMQVLIENHVLLKDKNVIVTPHSAFFTQEALERILDTTIDNVKGFAKKKAVNSVLK
jgi:D-lactate dehydrogenase